MRWSMRLRARVPIRLSAKRGGLGWPQAPSCRRTIAICARISRPCWPGPARRAAICRCLLGRPTCSRIRLLCLDMGEARTLLPACKFIRLETRELVGRLVERVGADAPEERLRLLRGVNHRKPARELRCSLGRRTGRHVDAHPAKEAHVRRPALGHGREVRGVRSLRSRTASAVLLYWTAAASI